MLSAFWILNLYRVAKSARKTRESVQENCVLESDLTVVPGNVASYLDIVCSALAF